MHPTSRHQQLYATVASHLHHWPAYFFPAPACHSTQKQSAYDLCDLLNHVYGLRVHLLRQPEDCDDAIGVFDPEQRLLIIATTIADAGALQSFAARYGQALPARAHDRIVFVLFGDGPKPVFTHPPGVGVDVINLADLQDRLLRLDTRALEQLGQFCGRLVPTQADSFPRCN